MSWARAALVGLAGFAFACAAPSATPGDMTTVLNQLAARGVMVRDIVAGDAGCNAGSLSDNATRLELTLAADGRGYTVYLFRWRRAADFAAADAPFANCVAAHAGDPAAPVEVVAVAPWRAYGPRWTMEIRDVIVESLLAAAGDQ